MASIVREFSAVLSANDPESGVHSETCVPPESLPPVGKRVAYVEATVEAASGVRDEDEGQEPARAADVSSSTLAMLNAHVTAWRRGKKGGTRVGPEPYDDGVWEAATAADAAWRAMWMARVRATQQEYTEDEDAVVARGIALLEEFESAIGKKRELKSQSSRALRRALSSVHVLQERERTKYDRATGRLLGEVQVVIRGEALEIVAFIMHYDSQRNRRVNASNPNCVRSECLESVNDHHMVAFNEFKSSSGFRNRTFLHTVVWKQLATSPATYVLAAVPLDEHRLISRKDEKHAIRATIFRSFLVSEISEGMALLRYAFWQDPKVPIPRWVIDKVALPQQVGAARNMQRYFLQIVRPNDFTDSDGALLGNQLVRAVSKLGKAERASAVKLFVRSTAVLNQAKLAPWLGPMLVAATENTLRTGTAVDAQHDSLDELTAIHGTHLGHNLLLCLATCADADSAVDEWCLQFASLQEACATWPWFKPMMTEVAQWCLVSGGWGLSARTGFSLILTYVDLSTDLYAYFLMIEQGQYAFAHATLGILGVSMAAQLALVLAQNHRNVPFMLKEMVLTVCLLKPFLDARRAVRGDDKKPHQVYSRYISVRSAVNSRYVAVI
jgi:hypothetical protein